MSRSIIRAAMTANQPESVTVVVAARPCHVTQALINSLQQQGPVRAAYVAAPAENAVQSDTGGLESQQQDAEQLSKAQATLQENIQAAINPVNYTGKRHLFVLTGGMYGGDDPDQFGILKAMVDMASDGGTPEAVLIDTLDPQLPVDERRESLQADASLEAYLQQHGIPTHYGYQLQQATYDL